MPLVKFHADEAFADKVMRMTGCRVASKAFNTAASMALRLESDLRLAADEISQLRRQVAVQAQVIERARESAAALLDHVAQGDMLDSVPTAPPTRRRPASPGEENGTDSGISPRAGESMDHFLVRLGRQAAGRST